MRSVHDAAIVMDNSDYMVVSIITKWSHLHFTGRYIEFALTMN